MDTYSNINEASKAAQSFFSECFSYNDGVGVLNKKQNEDGNDVVEFYSKNDPAMDDTFICIVITDKPEVYSSELK